MIGSTCINTILTAATVIGTTFIDIHAIALIPGIRTKIGFQIGFGEVLKRKIYDRFILVADIEPRVARATERSNRVDANVRTATVTMATFVNIYVKRHH